MTPEKDTSKLIEQYLNNSLSAEELLQFEAELKNSVQQKQIEKYLDNTLSEKEKLTFEKELDQSEELRNKVELTRITNKVILKNRLWEVRELTKERISESKTKARTRNKWLLGIALLTTVGMGGYLLTANKITETTTINKTESPTAIKQEKVVLVEKEIEQEAVTSSKLAVPNSAKNADAATVAIVEEKRSEVILPQHTLAQKSERKETATLKEQIEIQNLVKEPSKQEKKLSIEEICSKTKIEAKVQTENACSNQNNGRITVSNFKGGISPYSYKIVDDVQKEHSASHLTSGHYSVVVTDGLGCSTSIQNLSIKEEICEKDFELNPDNGDIWEYGTCVSSAMLSVYDAGENIYFYKQFATGDKIKWNGVSTKGEILPGYFLFIVKYQDGKTREGSITIIK